MLSTLSSEASVLILFLITLDRYLSIVRPFAEKNSSMNVAYSICGSLWLCSFILAATPLLGPFSSYFDGFYASNGLCLPLHIHNPYDSGWEYSFFLFVLINSCAFIFMCFAYIKMFEVIRDSTLTTRSTQQKQDSILAKRFALVVVTDFLCWAPIVVAKVVGMSGVSIPSELNAWLAVFALPVNSSLNPIIYTITTKLFQQQMGKLTRSFHSRLMRRSPDADQSSSIFRYRTTRSGTGNTSLHSIRQNITAGSRQNKNNFNPNLQAIPMKNIVTLPDPIFNQCENRTHFHPKKSKSRNNKCDDEHSHFTSACSTSFGNLCDLGGIEDLGGNNKSVVVVIRNEGESEIL
ncbi:Relaxin receptor 1 [Folsomia candida]|uniref:Relaxin receptor 1 n=2 Tax=Folsomia candida TaxID=158441 RepID=A0A226ET46_FOLCA|nr:Relaxin receptor 1 [Folsomia candida]